MSTRVAIDQYLELACRQRFGIVHVVETHTHAGHVSGNRRLAELTGATIRVSAGATAAFASRRLRAGDSITVGSAVLTARATPGHRPEHLSFVLADRSRSLEPLALLAGDTLLVREVGRHLAIQDEAAFVARLTESLPPRPPRVDRVVELNRARTSRPRRAAGARRLRSRAPAGGRRRRARRALGRLVRAGHLAGAVNLPLASGSVGTRAGRLIDPGRAIAIYGESGEDARRARWMLAAVGLFAAAGIVAGAPRGVAQRGPPGADGARLDPVAAARAYAADEISVLDVRDADEWERLAIAGADRRSLWELGDWQPGGACRSPSCALPARARRAGARARERGRAAAGGASALL